VKDHARTFNFWLRLQTKLATPAATRIEGMLMNDYDSVGDYAVPVDPMDDLQCESCQ
jgi:hypothetical protein